MSETSTPETTVEHHRPAGALAIQPDQTEFTEQQRAALAQIGVEDASRGDLAVFLTYAQRTGLDPWTRQLYMIARWDGRAQRNKYTIQASIDGLRIVAQRSGEYAGQVGPEWCGPDGAWRDVWLAAEPPSAARVGVLRKGWAQPQYAVAIFREYAGTTRDGSLTQMWREKPAVMIAKCAEALALRKAFPHDLSGIYTSDEMSKADVVEGTVVTPAPAPAAPPPPPPVEGLDADLTRAAILGARSREQLVANLVEIGGAVLKDDGSPGWRKAALVATVVPNADGVEVTAWELIGTTAAGLPQTVPAGDDTDETDEAVEGVLV